MKLKRAIYLSVGCLGCVLGAVGAVLPLLPSFPFLMLAAWCFAKIILMVSGLMGIGVVMMHNVPGGRVLLVLVWVFHLLYFSFGVKTLKAE